jgi:hypothetical protein
MSFPVLAGLVALVPFLAAGVLALVPSWMPDAHGEGPTPENR